MIIDGRTITTLAELKTFADDAVNLVKVDPAQVLLSMPLNLHLLDASVVERPNTPNYFITPEVL